MLSNVSNTSADLLASTHVEEDLAQIMSIQLPAGQALPPSVTAYETILQNAKASGQSFGQVLEDTLNGIINQINVLTEKVSTLETEVDRLKNPGQN